MPPLSRDPSESKLCNQRLEITQMNQKVDTSVRSSLVRSAEARNLVQAEEDRHDGYASALGRHTLYRYKSLLEADRQYTIDIIANRRVHLSSPDKFNDPFDVAPRFALGGDPNDPAFVQALMQHQAQLKKALAREELEKLQKSSPVPAGVLALEMEKAIRANMIRMTRVLCLSGHNLHPLSWAHYASAHTGVCFHFSSARGSLFAAARKVLYHETREPVIIDGKAPAADTFYKIALTKAKFWEYEDEYRIVTTLDGDLADLFDTDDCIPYPSEVLTGITLGMLISEYDRHEMLWHAKNASPPIPVWQARMHSTKFWMDEDRIE